MNATLEKWILENEIDGHYSAFAGFEKDIHAMSSELSEAYDRLYMTEQIHLFDFVIGLLEKEAEHWRHK